MKPFLMGSETEYSMSGRELGEQRKLVPLEVQYRELFEALREEVRCVPDAGSSQGLYLENGGRFYCDAGPHPEYATPEVSSPLEAVCYDKAGEALMQRACARVRRAGRYELSITKNNIGVIFPDRVTFGSHESYTLWGTLLDASVQLVPHLVSRIVYAGSGCLSANPQGMGFELSQRARHMMRVSGEQTTCDRAIFCTRIRKAADASNEGWVRAHMIGKDSHRAPLGIYLTFGATGLIFLLINSGRTVGKGLALADPIQALRAISLDPWLKTRVRLADGRQLTALEIQGAYLEECERAVQRGGFPDWSRDVLRHWRETLEQLARDPFNLARRLDPYLKLCIYQHELRRAGYDWTTFQRSMQLLSGLRDRHTEPVLRAALAENPATLPLELHADFQGALAAIRADGVGALDRLRFVIRMQALDLKYHELGGLYDELLQGGLVDRVVVQPDDVERATTEPPPGWRAAIRGASIKAHHHEPGWAGDWRYLMHQPSRTCIDLRNPWETQVKSVGIDKLV